MFAAQTTSFDITSIAQYGVLGLLVLAFIVGKVVPGYILERREQEILNLRAENKALREAFEEKVIPALIRSTDILIRLAGEAKDK